MNSFTRTPEGQVAKHLFVEEVILWVEGVEDIPFYDQALKGSCRIEAAGGLNNLNALVEQLKRRDLPYAIVVDGDYSVVRRFRRKHRRLVRLKRYSTENYFCEELALQAVCRKLSQRGPSSNEPSFSELINFLGMKLKLLIALDLANQKGAFGLKVLPNSADALLASGQTVTIDETTIRKREEEVRHQIDADIIAQAISLVDKFCQKRRILDLLRGHIVLGILRRIIVSSCRVQSHRKPSLSDDALRLLLTQEVWSIHPRPSDHRDLLRELRAALRDAAAVRSSH